MAFYTVKQRYSALRDGVRFGPYEPGTTVDLDEPDAEWINRDSPGTLSPAKAKAVRAEEKVEEPPVQPNRAHKGGRNRAGA